jgi:serine/threonine-protein kinase RCK2
LINFSAISPSFEIIYLRHTIDQLSFSHCLVEPSLKMSTIQNLKNFIRHGKQARAADPPRDHPTTNVSPVHAQPQKYHHGVSEPAVAGHYGQHQYVPQPGQHSVAIGDNRNVAAQAGGVAAHAAGKNQKIQQQADIEAIVAEEREKASKMPRYPGLERFILVEKMGDGAFSNVYKARDTQTGDEVAIKVVRKFEMNNNQVCLATGFSILSDSFAHLLMHLPSTSPV